MSDEIIAKICLAKNVVIFYSILAPFIIVGSLYNLYNIIYHEGSIIVLGAFSMFGFILIPLGIYSKIRDTTLKIKKDEVKVSRIVYKFSDNIFQIVQRDLPFKDRPIFSPFKNKLSEIVIKDKHNGSILFQEEIDNPRRVVPKLMTLLPISN